MGETIQTDLERGFWTGAENREKIDSVYVGEFIAGEFSGDAGCLLISINTVQHFSQAAESISSNIAVELIKEEDLMLTNMMSQVVPNGRCLSALDILTN